MAKGHKHVVRRSLTPEEWLRLRVDEVERWLVAVACPTGPWQVREAAYRGPGDTRWLGRWRRIREGELFACDNGADASVQRGISQTVELDQAKPEPIVAVAWSKAEGVGGSPNQDYSVYLDLVYADGTSLEVEALLRHPAVYRLCDLGVTF